MDDVFFMEILETRYEACDKESGGILGESALAANVVAQVATGEVVHDEVEILSILEGVVHVDDERIF